MKFMQHDESGWRPPVLRVSSAERRGIDEAWSRMKSFYSLLVAGNKLETRRGRQQRRWMWNMLSQELLLRLRADPQVAAVLPDLESRVEEGTVTSGSAAETALDV
ncbi:hypothetical protein HK405_002313, partial [Cladochytrium tenue]